jgi:hypothetical protein
MINGAYTEAWLRNFADRIAALAVQEVEWERSLAERMRDIWRDNAMHEKRHAERAKAQLATAKREELDETCKRALAGDSEAFSTLCARVLAIVERNAIHPATPSGETKCADVAGCDGKCCATPSPEAREVVIRCEVSGNPHDPTLQVRITPADAQRIMELAQRSI